MQHKEFEKIIDSFVDKISNMTLNEFNESKKIIINRIKKMQISKNKEYARDGDKLSNFKKAADDFACTPEQALIGMVIKHWQSIKEMVDDILDDSYHPINLWVEKIGDSLLYEILLFALIKERSNNCNNRIILDKNHFIKSYSELEKKRKEKNEDHRNDIDIINDQEKILRQEYANKFAKHKINDIVQYKSIKCKIIKILINEHGYIAYILNKINTTECEPIDLIAEERELY